MTPENDFDPALERAVSEIRNESIPDSVVQAAASRVWRRLASQTGQAGMAVVQHLEHIRDCAGFQALFPALRAGQLPESRALLVGDHLHECVACRRIFEGRVIPIAAPQVQKPKADKRVRWAVAAGIVATGGLVSWYSVVQLGGPASGRATVQSVNGTLYEVSSSGLRVMAAGEPLPDGAEIRTARDSGAVLLLRDGSRVEARERSELSTTHSGSDLTVHLDRGSVIVQAAKRRTGHLFLATADCRVAVTGTVFSVNAGVKGSRVSVVEGEVHVNRDNQQTVLHRGGQFSTSDTLEPLPVPEEISWTHDKGLRRDISALQSSLSQVPLPKVRYGSHLLSLLPASTVFYASIPNLSEYFAVAQRFFRERAAENPELRAWLDGPARGIEPVFDKLRAANEYLGDEIVVFGTPQTGPMFLAETKRPGLKEFLERAGLPPAFEPQPGIVLLSPHTQTPAPVLDSSFSKTEFYARIRDAYSRGTGMLFCADLLKLPRPPHASSEVGFPGRYLVAAQRQVGDHMETRAAITSEGPRSGIGAWLAAPSPMGALDYITPEATILLAFAVARPQGVVDELVTSPPSSELTAAHRDLAMSLGGEIALALDGSPLPVPSWKLVAEVYDPQRFQAALEKCIAVYNRDSAASGKQLRLAHETAEGRTYYSLTWGDAGPLATAQYTFASGYLIAAPARPLLTRALEARATGISIARSPAFTALLPHDPYSDFSAVLFQNVGNSLAPFAGLLNPKAASGLTHVKPLLVAAYGGPDRITLASTGDLLGMSFQHFLTGSVLGMAKDALPLAELLGTSRQQVPYR